MSDRIRPEYTVLRSQELNYEDFARVNPFYEPFMNYWTSPPTSDTNVPFDSRSENSSEYIPVGIDSSDITPLDSPCSSIPSTVTHQSQRDDSVCVLEAPSVTIRSGCGHQPRYHSYSEREVSQTATMELSPILHLSPNVAGSNDVLADDPWSEPKPSHKRLFGEKGWLGNNADLKELAEGNHKTFGLRRFGKKLKMQVEELVEDLTGDIFKAHLYAQHSEPLRQEPTRAVLISLDAPTQARLYSQLEVMICVAANRFLVQQCNRGLLSDESISKISNYWAAKNRPKVVEFHYDQATQRQLILSNLRTIQFHGLSATNSIQLRINLNNWKAIGKEMGIRTFCAPDSAIRKHVFDIRNILEMLGAPLETMRDFEVVQVQVLLLMEPD